MGVGPRLSGRGEATASFALLIEDTVSRADLNCQRQFRRGRVAHDARHSEGAAPGGIEAESRCAKGFNSRSAPLKTTALSGLHEVPGAQKTKKSDRMLSGSATLIRPFIRRTPHRHSSLNLNGDRRRCSREFHQKRKYKLRHMISQPHRYFGSPISIARQGL